MSKHYFEAIMWGPVFTWTVFLDVYFILVVSIGDTVRYVLVCSLDPVLSPMH